MAPQLAHYEILDKIGQGGMGVVFRARDTRLERTVALKLLRDPMDAEPGRRSRFLREARAAARLNHPSIATVYDVGQAEIDEADFPDLGSSGEPPVGRPPSGEALYIAMEYVEGEDLQARLSHEPLPLDDVLDLSLQITEGLAAAHRAGVIHRDLKPHNIRITPEGRVKILDFGLAKLAHQEGIQGSLPATGESFETARGMIIGTVPYMAPEQLQGNRVDSRSDLFSLGVLLYQMLTGRLPYASESLLAFLKSLSQGEPEPLSKTRPQISRELEGVVDRLLRKEPEQRYQSAGELASDLRALAGESHAAADAPRGTSTARASGPARHPSRRPALARRHRFKVLLGAVAVLLLLAGFFGLDLMRRSLSPAPVPTVLVMPFYNMTGNPSQDHLCNGISSLLTIQLSEADIPAVGRSQVWERGRGMNVNEMAREQAASSIVEGWCQRLDEEVVVLRVALRDAASTTSLWSEVLERRREEIFDLHQVMAYKVVQALAVPLSLRQRQRLERDPSRTARAMNPYFRGLQLLEGFSDADELRRAVGFFTQAIEQDDEFALAYAGLSEAKWQLFSRTREVDYLEQAEAAAQRAVELDPPNPRSQIALAKVYRGRALYDDSIRTLGEVLEEHPNLLPALYELALSYGHKGELEQAEEVLVRVIDKRPHYWRYWNQRGDFRYQVADYVGARRFYETARDEAPREVTWPSQNLALVELAEGNYDATIEIYESLPRTKDAFQNSNLGTAYFYVKDYGKAIEFYQQAVQSQAENPSLWANLGDAQFCLGQDREGRDSYRRALELTEGLLAVDPNSVYLRSRRPLYLARTGQCEAMEQAASLARQLAPTADTYLRLARAYVVCGDRDRAVDAITQARARGASRKALEQQYEFEELLADPALDKLLD